MPERFPDIEIYIYKADPEQVKLWLATALAAPLTTLGSEQWQGSYNGQPLSIVFNTHAEKNFASLWFKQNNTPWNSDLDCAKAAHLALGCEIRCSASGWEEAQGENSEDQWFKLIHGETKRFTW